MEKLKVKNLNFTYDKNNFIIKDVSFSVEDKKAVAILGESGSGKTTLLKLIIGLLKGSGEIYLNGIDASLISIPNKNLSYISQSFTMYPNLNVYNNIAMPLKASKIEFNELDNRVKNIAKFLNIDYLLTRKSKELSLGQQQRVALARSLIKHSDLYLFDEPFSNLDLPTKADLRKKLNDYRQKYQATYIFVTHDINDALQLADYIIVLDKGQIIQEGKPNDVYNNPINETVKKLICGNEINDVIL